MHDEGVGLIQARINEMRAERKKSKALSDDSTLKEISEYDEYIANSSMGLNRKETSKSQDEVHSEAEFRKVSAAATEIRQQQFRNFQRAIVAYEQQGHTMK